MNEEQSQGAMPDTEPADWQVRWTQEYLGVLLITGLHEQPALKRALKFAQGTSSGSLDGSRKRMIAAKAVKQAMHNLTGYQGRG